MQTESVATNVWSNTKKFVTRFFAVYFVIYIFPFPLRYIQFTQFLNSWYSKLLGYLVSFTGKHIFNVDFPLVATNNGSGDTTYNYVQLFLFVVFAFIIVIAWGITDKKLKYYNTILYWIHFYLFYYLALMMIRYGLEKVIKVQFSFPYYSLNETYGESSPMRLLWTFMGYSKTFNFFTGLVEIAAGIFLLFKKTKTFGALLSIAALVNVVVINFSYDVPVKLFATNLLLMVVFVLSPDIKRVYDFFFRNRAVAAVYVPPNFSKQWMKSAFDVIKFAIMVSAIYTTTKQIWYQYNISGDAAFNKTPLFGIYTVESFAKEKDSSKTLLTDSTTWKTLSIIFSKQASIQTIDGKIKMYHFYTDTINKKITLYKDDDSTNKSVLSYSQNSTQLNLSGKLNNDSVYISLQKQDVNKFPLLERKFHWINEAPYNK